METWFLDESKQKRPLDTETIIRRYPKYHRKGQQLPRGQTLPYNPVNLQTKRGTPSTTGRVGNSLVTNVAKTNHSVYKQSVPRVPRVQLTWVSKPRVGKRRQTYYSVSDMEKVPRDQQKGSVIPSLTKRRQTYYTRTDNQNVPRVQPKGPACPSLAKRCQTYYSIFDNQHVPKV